jgi:hypothetical protein
LRSARALVMAPADANNALPRRPGFRSVPFPLFAE